MSIEVVQSPPGFFQSGGTGSQVAKGIIPSIINYFTQRKLQKEQNEFNRQQIHEQNEYNSPSATMNRMIAAGISPKAAQESIAQVPTLGAQSSVATAAPFQGNMPGTDFMAGMSQGFANDLVNQQTMQQRINNQSQDALNRVTIQETQARIMDIRQDLPFKQAIRNLQVANLDLQHLQGLAEYAQISIELLQNPYVMSDYIYHRGADGIGDLPLNRFSAPTTNNKWDYVYSEDDGEVYGVESDESMKSLRHLTENRVKNLKTFQDAVYVQMISQGLERARVDAQKTGIQKEISNYLDSLNSNGKVLLAQGAIADLQYRTAKTGLERTHALMKLADIMNMFGPLMNTMLMTTQMYNNVSSGAARSRLSHSSNWQFNPSSVSMSW